MPLADPPSARLRSEDSTPRRRSSDPAPRRRTEDNKPANSPFGAFLIVLVAVLFLGYVFNVAEFASTADQLFAHLNESAQSENDLVVHVVAMLFPGFVCVWRRCLSSVCFRRS